MIPIPMIVPQMTLNTEPWKALQNRLGDLSPIFGTMIDTAVTEFLAEQFATEGQYGGTPWAPLAQLTLLLRQRPGHGLGGIGFDTGRMWSSLVERNAESAVLITPVEYRRSTTVPYAEYFHEGTERQPARPIIPDPMPQFFVDQITNIISYWVATGRESAGRRADPRVSVEI